MMTAVAGECKIKRKSTRFCCFFCQQQFREMGDYRQDLGIFVTSRCQLLYNIARPQYSNEYLSVLYIRKNPRLAYRHNVLNVKVIVIADVQKCRREIAAPAEDMSLFLVACCTNCWQLAQILHKSCTNGWQVAQILHKWLHKCLAQKAVCSILGAAHYLVRSAC